MSDIQNETGAERLRRIVRCLDWNRESALDGFGVIELIRIVEAIWALDSDVVDVMIDELSPAERKFAARHGRLSKECERRLRARF